MALAKNLALPVLVALAAWAWGLRDLPWTVLVVAAGVPVGANVFLFAQRYRVAQEDVTAATAVSTALAVPMLSGWMLVTEALMR